MKVVLLCWFIITIMVMLLLSFTGLHRDLHRPLFLSHR